jgi:predicted peroxiredoxin
MTTATQQKFLVNNSYGPNDVERATVAFILALSATYNNAETAMFATSDAAKLCVKGGADDLVAEGYEPLCDLMEDYIWLCPVCAKAKGISEEGLHPGVIIAGAPKTMEFIASGAQLLA